MKILTPRCTPKMALTMRRVLVQSAFFSEGHPVIDKLLALEWIRPDEIRQYALTDEGHLRFFKWKENKKDNYRHIGCRNPIYTDRHGHWAWYIAPPWHKRKGDRIHIDGYIIKEMIKNGDLVFNKANGYWHTPYRTGPRDRTHGIGACDLSL